MSRGPVAVALSGGKDSSVAVRLLREQGREVFALHMRLGLGGDDARAAAVGRLADALGVGLEVVDLSGPFRLRVLDYFLAAYAAGRTPNPCLVCNRWIKFGLLRERALAAGAAFLATGHYADRVRQDGRWFLSEPRERSKSQLYFLAGMEPPALERVLFPLAACTLAEVRRLAAGLPLANVAESQDACFLGGAGLGAFLRRHLPQADRPGDILDASGRVIGRHRGILHYTVGQRRGTGLAAGRRLYVLRVDAAANTVVMGDGEQLQAGWVAALDPVYWRELHPGEELTVRIRYRHEGTPAEVTAAEPGALRARFLRPVRALTPGQFAVFYDGPRVVAAGEIAPPGAAS